MPTGQAGFNMSWELDFWGRFRRAIESSNANLDSSVENFDGALVTLLADVATNYVQYRVAQERLKIARDNIRDSREARGPRRGSIPSRHRDQLDVEQLRTLLEQTRSTIPALQIALGQANDTLCVLLGIPPRDLEAQLGRDRSWDERTDAEHADLGRRGHPGRPAAPAPGHPQCRAPGGGPERPDRRCGSGPVSDDLHQRHHRLRTQDLSKLFESRSFMGTITPNFKWNILNYGRIVNNVHLQEAKTQELIATYQNNVLTAAQQVQTALRGFLRSREQAEALARSVKAAVAATKVQEKHFTDLKADVNRLFTLENTQVQAAG